MNRPLGVTVSAVVAIAGSILALMFAAAAVASLFIATSASQPPNSGPFLISAALTIVAAAIVGIWTGVGLFRLRPWARISILIFSAFMAVGSAFTLLGAMVVPMPPDVRGPTVLQVRSIIALTFGLPLVVAVWWLIQFNTKSTKAAFASPLAERASRRPISITVIAVASLIGGASSVMGILTESPAFLFGATFTGWQAGVIYAVFGALMLYIGKGLLDLREEARILGIGWSAFSIVHTCAIWLVPALRARLLGLSESLAATEDPRAHVAVPEMLMSVMFAFAVITLAATIWFLIRERGAFGQVESSI
jgi:hypothetical protein